MDNEKYREEINSALFKLNSDGIHGQIATYLDMLRMFGATEEESWKITHLMEKESYSFDRIKTIRDQIMNLIKEHESEEYVEPKIGEKPFIEDAIQRVQQTGTDKRKKVWSMAKEIEFKHLNILMEDTAYILAGVKSLIVFNLNKMAKKYEVEKPLDIINAYGMDVWDNTEQN